MSTIAITAVLLQNCMDLQSSELCSHIGMCAASSEVGNQVIHVQFSGITEMTEGQDHEPIASSLIRTDPGVSFMSVDHLACLIIIQNCLSLYKSVLVKQ
jgi:hypothetical protein